MCLLAAALCWLCLLPSFARAEDGTLAAVPQGLNAENALWSECPLGDYIADAVRAGTGAQIALIPSELLGADLVGGGSVTEEELSGLLREDAAVYVYTLTAPQLKKLLEESVSRWTLSERETIDSEASAYDGFLQISGFTMTADASAAPENRVLSVTLGDWELDLTDETAEVTAAIPEPLIPDISGKKADGTLLDLLRAYMLAQGTVEAPEAGRIRVIGAHARDIISLIPVWAVVVIVLVIGANAVMTRTRRDAAERRPW